MARVIIPCPETGKRVYTGMNFDWSTFEALEIGKQSFRCPQCRNWHTWTRRDADLVSDGAGG